MKMKKIYIIAVILIFYALSKLYVLHTDNPNDDNIPDQARDVLLQVINLKDT